MANNSHRSSRLSCRCHPLSFTLALTPDTGSASTDTRVRLLILSPTLSPDCLRMRLSILVLSLLTSVLFIHASRCRHRQSLKSIESALTNVLRQCCAAAAALERLTTANAASHDDDDDCDEYATTLHGNHIRTHTHTLASKRTVLIPSFFNLSLSP